MQRTIYAMSIKSKVTLAFIFFIVIPFSVLGLYTYNQSQRYMQDQLLANSQTTVKQIKYTIENKIDLIESVSNNITFNYRLQQFLGEPYSSDSNSLDTYFNFAAPLVNYAMLFQKINIQKISIYTNNASIPKVLVPFSPNRKLKKRHGTIPLWLRIRNLSGCWTRSRQTVVTFSAIFKK